eukprot:303724-Chlamydomonas_euryale.AAC.1
MQLCDSMRPGRVEACSPVFLTIALQLRPPSPAFSREALARTACTAAQVRQLERDLAVRHGSRLTLGGRPYPGLHEETLDAPHLIKFMQYVAQYDGPVHIVPE